MTIEFGGTGDDAQVNYEETDRELARLSAKIRQVEIIPIHVITR